MSDNRRCGVQPVVKADLMTEPDERPRWRCVLKCGHSVHRRQDKPPSQACCERSQRQQQPPTGAEAKARKAILQALHEVPGMTSTRLFEEVVSASCDRRSVADARARLSADGCLAGGPSGWTLTDAGRAELAEKRAA